MSAEFAQAPSPSYLLELAKLRANLQLIDRVQQESDCTIILALKGFAMWSAFPMVREYLSGCSASSYNEARLAREQFGGHVHLYAPAYTEAEFPSLLELSDRISFNSLGQWQRLASQAREVGISCGLRVNPLINEVATALYNPGGVQSRLGIPPEEVADGLPEGVEGLHVHALCESGADSSERLIEAVESHYGHLLPRPSGTGTGTGLRHRLAHRAADLQCAGYLRTGWGAYRHARCLRHRPYAGCTGDALSAGGARGR